MDKKQIDPAIYEKYVDASTALMLEYYSANHADPLSALPEDEMPIPQELDARCRADIKVAASRYRRKKSFRKALTVLISTACCLLLLLGLFSVLFVTVEAVRVPVINYFITKTDGYWQIAHNPSQDAFPADVLDPSDPLKGLLPEHLVLTTVDATHSGLIAIYDDDNGGSLFFTLDSLSSILRFDTENAQKLQEFTLNGHDAVLFVKDDRVTVSCSFQEQNIVCSISTTALTEQETLSLASQLCDRIDNSDLSYLAD